MGKCGLSHRGLLGTLLIPAAPTEPILTLARLTCPLAFVGSYFHFGLGFYWVLLANAATFTLIGLIVEMWRFPKPSTQL